MDFTEIPTWMVAAGIALAVYIFTLVVNLLFRMPVKEALSRGIVPSVTLFFCGLVFQFVGPTDRPEEQSSVAPEPPAFSDRHFEVVTCTAFEPAPDDPGKFIGTDCEVVPDN